MTENDLLPWHQYPLPYGPDGWKNDRHRDCPRARDRSNSSYPECAWEQHDHRELPEIESMIDEHWDVPARYRWAQVEPEIAFRWLCQPTGSLLLYGPPRAGKTHQAHASIFWFLRSLWIDTTWFNPSGLQRYGWDDENMPSCRGGGYIAKLVSFRRLMRSYDLRDGPVDIEADFKSYRTARLLAIDDLPRPPANRRGAQWRQTLDMIMRFRNEHGRATIITSRLAPGEIADVWGHDLQLRLTEHVVSISGEP